MNEIQENSYQMFDGQSLVWVKPKRYQLEPQPDVTPLEAVYIAAVMVTVKELFNTFDPETYEHWDLIKRHFVEVK